MLLADNPGLCDIYVSVMSSFSTTDSTIVKTAQAAPSDVELRKSDAKSTRAFGSRVA
jgi:hypothetical protein